LTDHVSHLPGNAGKKKEKMGADNLRKVAGYDFHLHRKKYDVQSMCGDLDPQWRPLKESA